MNEPNFQDRVKNKITGVTGTVIAKYPGLDGRSKVQFIDVRLDSGDRGVWYNSPAKRWEVTREYEEGMEE